MWDHSATGFTAIPEVSSPVWRLVEISRAVHLNFQKGQSSYTLVKRSKLSFSCRCFPVLLARSIHFPLNHLIVGFRSRSLASTLAMKLASPPDNMQKSAISTEGCHFDLSAFKLPKKLRRPVFCQSQTPTITAQASCDRGTYPRWWRWSVASQWAGWRVGGSQSACPSPLEAVHLQGTTLLIQERGTVTKSVPLQKRYLAAPHRTLWLICSYSFVRIRESLEQPHITVPHYIENKV